MGVLPFHHGNPICRRGSHNATGDGSRRARPQRHTSKKPWVRPPPHRQARPRRLGLLSLHMLRPQALRANGARQTRNPCYTTSIQDREAGVNPMVAKSTRGLGNYTTNSTGCIGTTPTAATAQPDKWTFGASGRSSRCPEADFAESGPPLLAQMRWHKAYRACERVEATI